MYRASFIIFIITNKCAINIIKGYFTTVSCVIYIIAQGNCYDIYFYDIICAFVAYNKKIK